ncbi:MULTISPECIES: hypothetical protein [unclassified Nocardiopsis]|uniref:hypothetical protein n=1 Tax=unclassified Nocardiopsis TaxID=2649073 RepID=UPI0021032A33|nr:MULTISPECIES: hypothetical protein [unclassified Nocardiopsis]
MTSTITPAAHTLREAMVREVVANRAHVGVPLAPAVEKALARVPREAFLPGLERSQAYADQAVVTKSDPGRGVALSSVSAPTVIALMLDRADIRPGHRVLEIGSGGYNAALISELVGPNGQVTSIDIDTDIIDRAQRCLTSAGYTAVHLASPTASTPSPPRPPSTGSSSPLAHGTCPPPGPPSSCPEGVWSCPCASAG